MKRLHTIVLVAVFAFSVFGTAQSTAPDPQNPAADSHAQQLSRILGLEQTISHLRVLQAARSCGAPATIEELSLRQDLADAALAASFDVDGVVAEIDNERALLMETRAVLGSKRDRAVNLMNVANLVTGTGLGIVVNALQFSDSTATLGDGIGVGSGIGSTVLSILGIRKQRGSKTTIGEVPNMLAPLFDKTPVLNAGYPTSVRTYLDSAPSETPGTATRLQSLKTEWVKTGHMPDASDKSYDVHLRAMTTSEDKKLKVSIDDISDRIAMLNDVSGRASLMKRDLASLMRLIGARGCDEQSSPKP